MRHVMLGCLFAVTASALAACGGGGGGGNGASAIPAAPLGVVAPDRHINPTPTPSPTPAPVATATPVVTTVASGPAPSVGGCPVFPADNPWNTDISQYPVDTKSSTYLAEMNPLGTAAIKPDFGPWSNSGIPFNVVSTTSLTPITFNAYAYNSDPGPYAIAAAPLIEQASDRHMLTLNTATCKLYETWNTSTSAPWQADAGAIFDLTSNTLRPEGWMSADAAGLPVFAGLARYDEVLAGAIRHALRFTMAHTAKGHIHPATHDAPTSSDPAAPPMGLRIRLKANFDTNTLAAYPQTRIIARALQTYGMMLADNGSDYMISGAPNPGWNFDTDLQPGFALIKASNFEVVQTGSIITP